MTIDLSDVQGNVVRGYGLSFDRARHFALGDRRPGGRADLPGRAGRRRHLRRRQRHLERRVGARSAAGELPEHRRHLAGAAGARRRSPPCSAPSPRRSARGRRSGPRRPSRDDVGLGDVGDSAPDHWDLGGPHTRRCTSCSRSCTQRLRSGSTRSRGTLRRALADHALTELSHRDARGCPRRAAGSRALRLPRRHRAAADRRRPRQAAGADLQPEMPTGDLLLGGDYRELVRRQLRRQPAAVLADNATYGASGSCARTSAGSRPCCATGARSRRHGSRARRGQAHGPLAQRRAARAVPDTPTRSRDCRRGKINAFDYAPDDPDGPRGLRCPIGAHVRRLNPRGSRVMGKPLQPPARPAQHALRPGVRPGPARQGGARPRRLLPVRRPRDAVGVHPARLGQRGHRHARHPRHARADRGHPARRRRHVHDPDRRCASRSTLHRAADARRHARQRLLPAAGHRRPALSRSSPATRRSP